MDTTEPAGLGTRDHIRATLQRARRAICASREQTVHSRLLLVRAGLLADASERAVQESLALRTQLHASITAYVAHLKADGVPAERVLVLVKTAVRDEAIAGLDPVEARVLMEDVVRWSVEAYYAAA